MKTITVNTKKVYPGYGNRMVGVDPVPATCIGKRVFLTGYSRLVEYYVRDAEGNEIKMHYELGRAYWNKFPEEMRIDIGAEAKSK
jgi:hypothetical protein